MTATSKFLESIKTHQESKKTEKFAGTLKEYLKLLEGDPLITVLSHKRLYSQILSHGMTVLDASDSRCHKVFDGDDVKVYDYFSSQFFGMERPLEKVMRFLHSAAMKGEESRQVLLLLGPVGAGKSALVEHIKSALEECDMIYVLKECPIREEPLHLIPRSLREEYDGDYTKFPITQTSFSVRGRKGVGVVPPMDPNTQDTSLLIGSEDISKLDLYPEDDPRALSLNGAFNVGNRGIVEFVEVFKNEIEFLHTMITATQEKNVPSPGKQAMIYFDGVILAHCNEAEWNKFKSEHTNEAILDRIVRVNIPYCLEYEQEVKIYKKLIGRSDYRCHIAPHTLEIAAMFAVLSRLKPSNKVDPLTKMKIYNGEEIVESGLIKKVDIKDLREETEDEGMTGISTRFLIKQVKEQIVKAEDRKFYLQFLQKILHEEYLSLLEKEITKAFVSAYDEQAESLFDNYLDHAEAYVNSTQVKDRVTNEDMEPDEKFLQSIEEQIGIKGSSKNNFRADITSYMFAKLRRNETIDWRSYGPLKEAIESKLVSSVRDISRIVTKSKSRDTKQQKKFNAMVQTLIEDYGYNEGSAEEVLKFASNNLWRDS
jgi:serine protein kinase